MYHLFAINSINKLSKFKQTHVTINIGNFGTSWMEIAALALNSEQVFCLT